MKNLGKVHQFNGVVGQIITGTDTYVFTYNGIDGEIQEGDMVTFKTNDNSDVVTDVTKYNNKDLKTLLREYREKN